MASSFPPPPPQFAAAPRRAFLFGESSIMNCLNVSGSTLLGTGDKNYVGWFNRLAGQPLSFSASNFYGALSNSTQLLAALQANVLAKLANFDIIFMAPLGNDVVTGVPAATSLANLKAMILPLLAAGKWVVLTAALPGNSSFFSANQGKQQVYLNQKVREWCGPSRQTSRSSCSTPGATSAIRPARWAISPRSPASRTAQTRRRPAAI